MRIKHFFFALVAMLICSVSSVFAQNVAKIGDTEYATLQAAMTEANKAAGNYTITLLENSADVFNFAQKSGVNITVDGDGNTFSGKITLNAGGGNLTFTDAKIAPANSQTIYLNASTAPNVTFDGCTLQGTNKSGTIIYGYASATNNALKVKNCTADNLQYIVSHRQTGAKSVLVENVTASNMIYLVRTLKCPSVTVKNVTVSDAVIGIDIKNDAAGGKLTLENVKINTVTYNGSLYCPVSGSGAGKSWTVELKGNNTFSANGVAYTDNSWFSGNAGYVIKDANVAKIGDKLYYDFATAFDAAQPGQTIVLLADYTGEPVTLAEGVKLEANGFNADGITVIAPAYTVQIGDKGYATLADAIAAAKAGETITFLADITENVAVNKAVTIDGAEFTYTGNILATNKIDVVIKNVNFDGKGYNGYAVDMKGAYNILVENCTAKNYGYGFLQVANGTVKVTVKDVKVSNMGYGVKVDYSNAVVLENVDITASTAAVLNSNYGEKTITIKNSKLNILGTWKRNDKTKTTYVFEGANTVAKFITEDALDNFKLAAGATLTAPEGKTVTTVEEYEVKYENGIYASVEKPAFVAMIGEKGYETFDAAYKAAKKGDVITLLETVVVDGGNWVNYSTKEITVKANFGDVAFRVQGNPRMVWFGSMTIESDDYCIIVGAKDGSTGADVDIMGGTYIGATTAISVTKGSVNIQGGTFKVEPYEGSYEYTINCVDANYKAGTAKVSINGGKFYNFNPANCAAEGPGTNFLSASKLAAQGEDGYYEVVNAEAKVNGVNYLTLKEAIAAAQNGDVVELCNNVKTNEIITIDKPITLNGWGRTLTSTAGRAINVETEGNVAIKNLTINASGERAINVITKPANVTIENVTATAANYTVNVASSAGAAKVAISKSTLNGLCTVNVAAAGAQVTIDNSTVNCNDNNTTAGESYAALCLNKAAVGASIIATNTTVNVTEGSDSTKGRNGAEDGTVTINGSTEDVNVTVAVITYEGSDYYYGFSSLAEAVAFAKEGDVITLIRNVTMDYNARDAYETQAQNVVIDGNGKVLTLNQKNSDWASFGLANDSKLVLKNMTIEKTGYGDTSGAWNTHAIIFSCPVEMNDVTVNNSVAVQAGATLNNVTINEANGFYGLWINGNGQAVTVNGGAINATNGGRGIKIADQYIDAPAQVTLNVNGTVFNTAKKAAVLVSSTAGAQITAANVDIANVAEDNVNFVWVDEDWAQYFANVEVTGAKVRAEGVESFAAAIVDGSVVKAYFKTLAAAVKAAPAGATVTLLDNVTLEGGYAQDPEAGLLIDKALTLDGKNHTIDCGTFVKGIRIYGPNGLSDININNVTVVNNNVNGRCVDTRAGLLRLKFSKANLIATNTNSQPLTVGGSDKIHQIDLSGCTIDAGNSGYAIISFVPTSQTIKIMNSTITGYAAVYLKGDGTKVTITTNSDVIGKNVLSGASNAFGAVVFEGNNNTVNINATSPMLKAVAEGGAEQAAILIKSGTGNKVVLETSKGANIVAEGENAYWAMVNEDAEATITKNGAEVALVAEANGYQFVSFEEAIRIAKNGGEVKLLADVALDTKTLVTDCDGYSSIINVEDMELTFDLNGYTMTVDAAAADLVDAKSNMLLAVFSVDEGGKLTINDSSEAKTGAVVVNANDATVYSVVTNYTDGAYTTINGGKFVADKLGDSMVYSGSDNAVKVYGGTFLLANTGTGPNGKPWIFNGYGQNGTNIEVYGGTYNTDVNHQYWAFEVEIPETLAVKDNNDGTWTVVPAAASVLEKYNTKYNRTVGYATIEEAVDALAKSKDGVVTMVADVTVENPVTVAAGQTVVLNLNGKTISATENATGSYALITNRGNLTIEGEGAITLTATNNRGWNAYSSVISNTVGGKLTVNGGTIQHNGGTDMAYGIDNLTNGKGTYAETIINGGEIISTYRAIRMFLNGIEADNILTVNGGTIEGANKSIWMQDPSKNANTGNLRVGEDALLKGNVYLTVTAGSTQWPVQAYIEKAALDGESTVLTNDNVPADAAALVDYDTFWQVEQKNLAELTIVDEDYAEYINKVEKTVGKLTYVRNFENTEWQTLYLPFEVPVEALTAAGLEAAYIYNASYKDGAAIIDHVVMEEGTLAANYPYFVRATEAGVKSVVVENATLTVTDDEYDAVDCSSVFEKFTFTGTYNVVDADNLDENKGHFVKEGADWETMDEVYAFRVYLTIELRNGDAFANPQAIRMRSVDHSGKTTGVDSVDAEQAGEFIFDLQGRRVAEPEKGGIYIINGQKVLVK